MWVLGSWVKKAPYFEFRIRNIVVLLTPPSIPFSKDEGTMKTENPKCRLYWCLIEFIDWRYSQSC
jgi:hypothetical protein